MTLFLRWLWYSILRGPGGRVTCVLKPVLGFRLLRRSVGSCTRHMLGKQLHQPCLGEMLKLMGMLLPEQGAEVSSPVAAVERVGLSCCDFCCGVRALSRACCPGHLITGIILHPACWEVWTALALLWTRAMTRSCCLLLRGFFQNVKWFVSAALSWWRRLTRPLNSLFELLCCCSGTGA